MNSNNWQSIFDPPAKRKVFVSYHHGRDQGYYDAFIHAFSNTYDVITDNSLNRAVDSDNPDYVMRRIRESYITGSSCTIVLCGVETPWRKYVDWEIKATLDKNHGLIGVNLPTNPQGSSGKFTVPDRLYANIQSNYAIWTIWAHVTSNLTTLPQLIEQANSTSAGLINNSTPIRQRNSTPPISR